MLYKWKDICTIGDVYWNSCYRKHRDFHVFAFILHFLVRFLLPFAIMYCYRRELLLLRIFCENEFFSWICNRYFSKSWGWSDKLFCLPWIRVYFKSIASQFHILLTAHVSTVLDLRTVNMGNKDKRWPNFGIIPRKLDFCISHPFVVWYKIPKVPINACAAKKVTQGQWWRKTRKSYKLLILRQFFHRVRISEKWATINQKRAFHFAQVSWELLALHKFCWGLFCKE